MKYKFDANELTSEKSMWDIYILSKKIKPSKTHILFVIFTALFLIVNAFVFSNNIQFLLRDVRNWSSIGFNFSISTLGFLISGFTIFATLSKPTMLLSMMDHINKPTGLPTLKYNFFAFMKVFIAYITLSGIYLSVMLFGQPHGLIANLIELLPCNVDAKLFTVRVAYVALGTSFIYLILLLKSFIFNIYTIVMNFLRWEYNQN